MHYSKLATTLNHQQKNRRFQAFATCEVIAIDRYRGQEIGNSLFLNITQYCFNSDLVGQTTLKILKLNHR